MAFSQEEKEALLELKQKGYSMKDALGFVASTRLGSSSRVERDYMKKPEEPSDAFSDISRGIQGIGQAYTDLGARSDEASQRSSLIGKTSGKLAAGLRFASDAISSTVEGGIRALPGGTNVMDTFEQKIGAGVQKAVSTPAAQSIKAGYDKLPQGVKTGLNDAGNIAQGTFDVLSLGAAPGAARTASKALSQGMEEFSKVGVKEVGEAGIRASTKLGVAPEDLMQRVARISKGKQAAFEQRAGESVGDYLVNRGIFGDPESVTEQLYSRMQMSKGRVDTGLAKIQGTYKNGTVDDALSQLAEREARVSTSNTPSRDASRVNKLLEKSKGGGLTLSEINEVKRLYERNVKVDYLNDRVSDKIAMATNIDSNLREFIVEQAGKSGFKNVKQLNMETTLAKQLMDDLGAEYAGQAGNNLITLSDAFFLAEAANNPAALAAFGLKKTISSKSFMSSVAKLINGKNARIGMPEAQFDDMLQLPAPRDGAANTSIEVPIPMPKNTQSTLDATERTNPNIKQPEVSESMPDSARSVIDFEQEATEAIRAQLLDIPETGIREFADGGSARFTSFPSWVPSELRDTQLFKRVMKHVDDGTVPKINANRELDLYAKVKSEIARLAWNKDADLNDGLKWDDIPFSIALAGGLYGASYYMESDGELVVPLVAMGAMMKMPPSKQLSMVNRQIEELDRLIDLQRADRAGSNSASVKDLLKARARLVAERQKIPTSH